MLVSSFAVANDGAEKLTEQSSDNNTEVVNNVVDNNNLDVQTFVDAFGLSVQSVNEHINPLNDEVKVPCCIRNCVIINGVKYCTGWTCGDCTIVIVIK